MSKKVVAVVGSYRRGGMIDTVVEAILEGARQHGATTQTMVLTEKRVEFCTNCRTCTQQPGTARGRCKQEDDMQPMLEAIDGADAVVLASAVNCYNVTAIFRRFMERLVGGVYWPWGQPAPRVRSKARPLKAVLVASAAMPGVLIPIATGARRALRVTAEMLGAKPVGSMWIGLAAGSPVPRVSSRTLDRARRLGAQLA